MSEATASIEGHGAGAATAIPTAATPKAPQARTTASGLRATVARAADAFPAARGLAHSSGIVAVEGRGRGRAPGS
jgi:hypothetical protein